MGGCFHTTCRVLFGQPDDAQTRSIAHLWMRLIRQDPLEESSGMRSDLFRPMHHARRRPLEMGLMALGPVLFLRERLASAVTAQMRGYALSLMEDLHGGRCCSNLDQFLHQVIRHAVEVGIEGDVVVDVYPRSRPLTHVEPLARQRAQCASFHRSEHTGARSLPLFERSLVQALE